MIRVGTTGRVGPIMIRVVVNRRTHREAQHRQQTSGDEGDWSGPDEYERLTGISKLRSPMSGACSSPRSPR